VSFYNSCSECNRMSIKDIHPKTKLPKIDLFLPSEKCQHCLTPSLVRDTLQFLKNLQYLVINHQCFCNKESTFLKNPPPFSAMGNLSSPDYGCLLSTAPFQSTFCTCRISQHLIMHFSHRILQQRKCVHLE